MQQGSYGQPGPQHPPPKKGLSGCLIALLVVAGLVVVGVLIAGIGVWKAVSSPEGQKIVKVIGEGAKLGEEARTAPGAQELRRAGCQEAMVLDPARMADLIRELGDGGPPTDVTTQPRMIVCQVGVLASAPSCDALAATYVAAAHPSTPFHVTVQTQGGQHPKCAQGYTADGKRRQTP